MKKDFDVIVIGGGSAGLFAASVANALGAKVCLVEKKKLGGDCTWFGCMPSKTLLKSASVAHVAKAINNFGLKVASKLAIDASEVMSHVRDVRQEIYSHETPEVFQKRGIEIILGSPQFAGKDSIEVNGKRIAAKKFIICTGSSPVVPPIEGLKSIDYLTNETMFDLTKLPQSLIVLGGGPIGLELSQSLSRLGVKVYVVEMLERILFREDKEASVILEKRLKEEGLSILTGKKAVKFERKNDRLHATLENKSGNREEISAENVLVAVGRAPNVEGLALEKAGVEYTKNGIKTNGFLQTTNKDIFACGDAVGPYMFSHVAAYQAYVCVRNALYRRLAWQRTSYQNIAWATFTDPEVSHLGLTEEEAKEKYKDIKVYKTEYANADRATTDLEKDGFVKVITDKKGFIVGAHIVGANASEIIQGLLIAKFLNQPLAKIAPALFIYPTLSELIKKTAAKALVESINNNPVAKFFIRVMKKI